MKTGMKKPMKKGGRKMTKMPNMKTKRRKARGGGMKKGYK